MVRARGGSPEPRHGRGGPGEFAAATRVLSGAEMGWWALGSRMACLMAPPCGDVPPPVALALLERRAAVAGRSPVIHGFSREQDSSRLVGVPFVPKLTPFVACMLCVGGGRC